jgi:broad specificity phosphatase PhoE
MQRLYLMRHGQSQANADQIIAGSHESPLSPIGIKQAEFAGDTARRYFQFDLIVSSPMGRAVQTAQIVAEHIGYPPEKILIIDSLRERDLGNVEGDNYTMHTQARKDGNYEDAENVPGVEPVQALFDRMADVLVQLRARPEQRILVVAHNGCGRMLKVVLRQQEPMDMYKQPRTENAIIYEI